MERYGIKDKNNMSLAIKIYLNIHIFGRKITNIMKTRYLSITYLPFKIKL